MTSDNNYVLSVALQKPLLAISKPEAQVEAMKTSTLCHFASCIMPNSIPLGSSHLFVGIGLCFNMSQKRDGFSIQAKCDLIFQSNQ